MNSAYIVVLSFLTKKSGVIWFLFFSPYTWRHETFSSPLGRNFGTLFWDDITIFWDENFLWFLTEKKPVSDQLEVCLLILTYFSYQNIVVSSQNNVPKYCPTRRWTSFKNISIIFAQFLSARWNLLLCYSCKSDSNYRCFQENSGNSFAS